MTTPDVWVIVELHDSTKNRTAHRILAGWYGGYLHGDSWRLSSGIEKIVEQDRHWEIHNHSGSIYLCHKETERFSSYTQAIFEDYARENVYKELSIKKVNLTEIVNQYQS